jgi:nicotinic acid mononucleotide adenylyltransferase
MWTSLPESIPEKRPRKPSSGKVSIKKIRSNLEELAKNKDTKNITPVVLVLGGSFCPLHLMHYQTFLSVKKSIDSSTIVVVAGYFVPTTDDYVLGKLGKNAISLVHRNALIDLTIQDCKIVENYPVGCANAFQASQLIELEIHDALTDLLKSFSPMIVYNVGGADFVLRAPKLLRDPRMLVVSRGKYTGELRQVIKQSQVDVKAVIVESDEEMCDFSSTQVRNAMEKNEYPETHLHPRCIEYLKENRDTIFGIEL